jgi:hypothetical protein
MTLKDLQIAGDWKDLRMAARYAHREASEVRDRARSIADAFGSNSNIVPLKTPSRRGHNG